MTPKHQRFVEEYLVDLNATQAYIRAGYSPNGASQSAKKLLRNTEIAAAIKKAMAERSERTRITADRVLQEYARIGFADIRAIVAVTPQGVRITPSDEWAADDAATVSEIKEDKDGNISLKMHSKISALHDMGKHLGLFIDRHEFTVKRLDEMNDEELRYTAGVEIDAAATRH